MILSTLEVLFLQQGLASCFIFLSLKILISKNFMLPQYHLTFIWLCYICIHSANFILVEVTTLTDINIEVINFFIMKKIF